VAGLALTVAVLLSLVAALLAVIVRTGTTGRLTRSRPRLRRSSLPWA
jgi:hypothetical protein